MVRADFGPAVTSLADSLLSCLGPIVPLAGATRRLASRRAAACGRIRCRRLRVQRKVRIRVLDDGFEAIAEDSILRALQMYGLARDLPSYGFARFCWNANCRQCILEFECDGARRRDFACQTDVREGMRIRTLPAVLMWKRKLKVQSGS
jgi:hypothetical protein